MKFRKLTSSHAGRILIAAVPVAIDWVRSSFFTRLGATADCALLLPDVPMSMDVAA